MKTLGHLQRRSILDVAAALDPPLIWHKQKIQKMNLNFFFRTYLVIKKNC